MRFLSTLVLAASALYASAAPAYDLANSTTTTLAERDLLERAPGAITTCKNRGEFALTFDDGPYWGNKPAKTLSDNGGRGTFFLNGNNWGCIYDRADQIIAAYKAGHTIGSHTWSHPDIAKLSEAQLHKQLDLVEGAFKKILGIKPRLFRPPYGSYNDRALKVLQQRGYTVVNWNFDSGDTAGKSASQIISAYNKLAYPNPYIALNHETKSVTVDQVIPKVVPMLKAKGYKLVTVDKCLGISPYQSVGAAGKRDKTWTCSGTLAPGQA
ncbi:hypothetical protein Rhopal_007003-T1 [Rhodotorula paludigena]|uniref:NodB homology domain-containing protein n=1 Tax=Rhodotorula paludigena TaxID=86838 RepID=A0AAV5GVG3_9BASI|nr:hypothetical protein Rhopal_007003-T1 [Rhodotorula paludigena]